MNRLEHQIERDLRQIADRATPSPDAWNSILTRIADQDPDTETEIIMLTETAPRSSRRWLPLAWAAAAVVAIVGAIVIALALHDTSPDDDQVPAPAATTTVAPTTLAPTTTVAPTTATASFSAVADDSRCHVHRAGRLGVRQLGVYKAGPDRDFNHLGVGAVAVSFTEVSNIYTDPCQWVLVDPPVGPTVDDLISAWANVPGFNATAAIDVTVDGYNGKQIEFTVPDYKEDECTQNRFGLWQDDGPASTSTGPNPTGGRRAPISTTSCGYSTSTVPASRSTRSPSRPCRRRTKPPSTTSWPPSRSAERTRVVRCSARHR